MSKFKLGGFEIGIGDQLICTKEFRVWNGPFKCKTISKCDIFTIHRYSSVNNVYFIKSKFDDFVTVTQVDLLNFETLMQHRQRVIDQI